ncbi:ABC transporter G family member 25-like isoform X2 [Phragmites australis]|uniref:ABC transporter G family member 25-like isoform X2 n=1 Tax=Phragmites australis TaxID=29695 RepID=UPI002D77512D|nr:ABC transporter G family member 25-like isoform X2 [Phragmites australis]
MEAAAPAAAAATESKMDCFLTTVCTPLNLQFIDVSYRVKVERSAAAKAPPGRISHSGGGAGVAVAVEERTILKGITGEARPGEVLAVLGPSGSGKSTLLSILGGRLAGRHAGTVLAGGRPPSRAVQRLTGFVAQDDVLHPHLTVRETLVFCAMLRLPRAGPAAAKAAAAEAVIAELGLAACADTIVGNAFVRGVSGGERKRVSIGHEMLVNPSLLILDEPTSGLDSTAAARLVATLSALARKGRTVVLSVHQPSSRVYRMFDSVLLLAEGSCLYYGAGRDAMDYFASVGFEPGFHVNPADFMLDLANDYNCTTEGGNVKQSLISSYNKELAPRVKASINAGVVAEHARSVGEQLAVESCSGCTSWGNQFAILLRRSLKERRHEAFTSLRMFQIIAPALVAGAMWWRSSPLAVQDRLGLLFFVSIFWGVFASFNAVFAFPQERPVLARERTSGMYALSSYFMSRMAGDLPMELVLPTAFTVIVYLMTGLNPSPAAFALTLAVILSYVLVAEGLGLAVGALMMDAKRASTLVTVIMLAYLLTGGFYVHNVPGFMVWAKYTSFTYYCYRLLIAVQYSGHLRRLLPADAVDGEAGPGACVAALVAMFFGYRLLAYLALRRVRT